MTIKEFVLSQGKAMGINDWIKTIKENDLESQESLIIRYADSMNLITINPSADFIKSINI